MNKGLKLANLPKEKTIKKRNNIVRMGTENNTKLSTTALKLYNFLYLAFQYHRETVEKYDYTISIKQTTIKDELKITNDHYGEIIINAFKELVSRTVVINNFTNSDGYVVKTHITSLLHSVSDTKSKEDNKTKIYLVKLDKTLFDEMMKKEAGYTDLLLSNIKPLRSPQQIRLYEHCKSYEAMTKSEVMTLDDLNKLFFTNFKHLSKVEELINRSIKRINEDTDIEITYKKDKKNKTIQFFIKPKKQVNKKQREYAKNKKMEQEALIKNVLEKVKNK